MGTTQAAAPEQAPVQPTKLNPEPACAERVTLAVEAKLAVQVPVEQLMPAGLLVTEPVPVTDTANANCVPLG